MDQIQRDREEEKKTREVLTGISTISMAHFDLSCSFASLLSFVARFAHCNECVCSVHSVVLVIDTRVIIIVLVCALYLYITYLSIVFCCEL